MKTKLFCNICDFSCYKKYYLQNHINKVHDNKILENKGFQVIEILNNYNKKNLNLALEKIKNKVDNKFLLMLYNFWTKYADRKFMIDLYYKIGKYYKNCNNNKIIEIGAMNYNYISKELFMNNNIEYTQIEPDSFDPITKEKYIFNCDKLLKCYVNDLIIKHGELKNYYSLVLDYILCWETVSGSWSDEKINQYVKNILYILDDDGILILKKVPNYNKIDFDKFIYPYFKLINFLDYNKKLYVKMVETGNRLNFKKRNQNEFYFLKKIKNQ